MPLLIGTAALTVVRGVRHHKGKWKAAGATPAQNGAVSANGMTKQQVLLAFDRVHCSLTDKKGLTKVQLLTFYTVPGVCMHVHSCPLTPPAHARMQVILDDVSGEAKPGR